MKFLKWLLIIVGGLLGLFIVVSFFLPKAYYVERSIDISAPAVLVYSQVSDLDAWRKWDPWGELDPDMTVTYGESRVGLGASYSWQSETSGDGTMEIVEVEAPNRIKYKLTFEGYEDNPSYSRILLEAGNAIGPTTVTWTFEGDVGEKLFARWMVLLMDKFVGMNYEKGLSNLKALCEGMIAAPPEVEG
ncbi:MAG: SRPBCC family protein [Puniceicoccaceae bacterium]